MDTLECLNPDPDPDPDPGLERLVLDTGYLFFNIGADCALLGSFDFTFICFIDGIDRVDIGFFVATWVFIVEFIYFVKDFKTKLPFFGSNVWPLPRSIIVLLINGVFILSE